MSQEIKDLEVSIEEAQAFIELQHAADRLRKNKDFQLLILEEYFKNEPVRMTEILAVPQAQDERTQGQIHAALRGVSELKQFFNKIQHQAMNAESAIEEANAEIDSIHEEGDLH